MKKINNLKINKEKIHKLAKLLLPIFLVTTMTGCQTKQTPDDTSQNEAEQVQVEEKKTSEQNNNSSNTEEINEPTSQNEDTQKNESEVIDYFNNMQNEFE